MHRMKPRPCLPSSLLWGLVFCEPKTACHSCATRAVCCGERNTVILNFALSPTKPPCIVKCYALPAYISNHICTFYHFQLFLVSALFGSIGALLISSYNSTLDESHCSETHAFYLRLGKEGFISCEN